MCRIDDDSVGTGAYQCTGTLQRVHRHTHTGSHTQPAFLILAGHRLVLGLGDILIGNQTHKPVLAVHYGQLLYLMFLQYLGSCREVGLLVSGHQILTGHDLVNGLVQASLKPQVTVRDNSHQMVVVVHHGDSANMVIVHHGERIAHLASLAYRHGIVNHTVLGTLHDGHLTGLLLNRHVFVNHTNTSLTGNGNGHRRLGHCIHSRCNKRHVQPDIAGKLGFQLYCLGQHFRISRD